MPFSTEVRNTFIDYFVDRGHVYVPPSPLATADDPTLFFVNAGMVPFKDVFGGRVPAPAPRAVNSQRCLRVSGKHNDLTDVGRSPSHHTFFEMLGFWSFGDYFKREPIRWVWDLLTRVWGLPPERLYATVFAGDERDGTPADEDAERIWHEETDIDPSHVLWFGAENFWEMADTGPCGPSSEVHIDLTPDASGGSLVNTDDPRVVEIGNIVFISYDRRASGALDPLPRTYVDFGAGFERLVAILQGKTSSYDTDLFTPLLARISSLTGTPPYGGRWDDPRDTAYRIVADHARCLTMAVADGVAPSNEGRGYVLRRILRRAVRHIHKSLGIDEPLLHHLVPSVVDTLSEAHPHLRKDSGRIEQILRGEEESFLRTIGRGLRLFERVADKATPRIGAQDAFKLHDTYGFPLDLTVDMARERGLEVDVEGFEELMAEARRRSRGADRLASLADSVRELAVPATVFTGYRTTSDEVRARLLLWSRRGGHYLPCDAASEGDEVALALAQTPFYAQSGGQVGDTGHIVAGDTRVLVRDTRNVGGVHVHLGRVESGTVRAGPEMRCSLVVDAGRRRRVAVHHTATHLLNLALRRTLGPHADQRGSVVGERQLRLDVSHPEPLTRDELADVERVVREQVAADLEVHDAEVPLADAMGIRNVRAVFGERYPSIVRVVAIGVPVAELVRRPDDPAWDRFSIELCGGTHLPRTAEAEGLTISRDRGLGAGTRRLVAVAGPPGDASGPGRDQPPE